MKGRGAINKKQTKNGGVNVFCVWVLIRVSYYNKFSCCLHSRFSFVTCLGSCLQSWSMWPEVDVIMFNKTTVCFLYLLNLCTCSDVRLVAATLFRSYANGKLQNQLQVYCIGPTVQQLMNCDFYTEVLWLIPGFHCRKLIFVSGGIFSSPARFVVRKIYTFDHDYTYSTRKK